MIVGDAMDFVRQYDPEVGAMIRQEYDRQCRNIELIASENIVSEAVMAAMGSVLTNKYAEGYPGKRYYGGCECVDEVERLAIARVLSLIHISPPLMAYSRLLAMLQRAPKNCICLPTCMADTQQAMA